MDWSTVILIVFLIGTAMLVCAFLLFRRLVRRVVGAFFRTTGRVIALFTGSRR